jgi:hypothetical protein
LTIEGGQMIFSKEQFSEICEREMRIVSKYGNVLYEFSSKRDIENIYKKYLIFKLGYFNYE